MTDLTQFFIEHALMRQVFSNLVEYLEDQGFFSAHCCTMGEEKVCEMNVGADDEANDLCYAHQIYMDCKNVLEDMEMREGGIQ